MDDSQLEARLFVSAKPSGANRPLPDWLQVHRDLRRPHVTLQLLHLEYRDKFPEGYECSQFCRLYRLWQRRLDVVMRQEHRGGEKLFVDFAGRTIPIVKAPAAPSNERRESARRARSVMPTRYGRAA